MTLLKNYYFYLNLLLSSYLANSMILLFFCLKKQLRLIDLFYSTILLTRCTVFKSIKSDLETNSKNKDFL